jgi:hypothetical protein
MSAKICNVCNIRRVYTGAKGTEIAPVLSDLCNYCFEEGGWENLHSDSNHDDILSHPAETRTGEMLEEIQGCWICYPELNLAQKVTSLSGTTKPKAQGARRPQLNHKGHSHPATPAARRECKKLFWAQDKVEAAAWDARLDGYGKPLPLPAPQAKPAKVTVVPRGPKGGVINQLKAAKPSK